MHYIGYANLFECGILSHMMYALRDDLFAHQASDSLMSGSHKVLTDRDRLHYTLGRVYSSLNVDLCCVTTQKRCNPIWSHLTSSRN